MPIHLLHSGDDQAVIAFLAVIFSGLCARYWRIALATIAALLIGAALIALSVIVDLRIAHEISGYLHELGHIFGR